VEEENKQEGNEEVRRKKRGEDRYYSTTSV
jgi:hypothetical protein